MILPVIKRVKSDSSNVYDDRGNLCFVLPPLSNPDANGVPSATVLKNLCYQYQYDLRNRVAAKKLPGKGIEYILYNKLDQPTLTQDSVQRETDQWLVTKYDQFGRMAYNGFFTATGTPAYLTSLIYASNQWVARNPANTTIGYTYSALGPTTYLTIDYYDNLTGAPGLPSTYSPSVDSSMMTTGLLVGTRTALLNNNARKFWNILNYDDQGRVIQAYKQHYYRGQATVRNYDLYTTTYNFNDQPLTVVRKNNTINIAGTAQVLAVTVNTSQSYDHLGRPINSWQQLQKGGFGLDSLYLVSGKSYNETGQLLKKKLHSTTDVESAFMDVVSYAYNPRGWASYMHDSQNKMNIDLYYQDNAAGTSQYNGNISQFKYEGDYSGVRTFTYSYDKLNQLKNATIAGGAAPTTDLQEIVEYDVNGNITLLTRKGQSYSNLGLHYYYGTSASNQLQTVSQWTSGTPTFAQRNYSYDGNGNATTDGYTQTINYNYLNLPQTITTGSTTNVTYNYLADGTKVRTVAAGDSVDYVDGIQYNNSALNFIATAEGRADNVTGVTRFKYNYNLTDHLGNVRVTEERNTSNWNVRIVDQEDEYYSFGLRNNKRNISTTDNRYLYNGKEIQTQLANQYDYGARFYDATIARWTVADPAGEVNRRFTPYAYVSNSPVNRIDPDGMIDYVDYDKQQENRIYSRMATEQARGAIKAGMDIAGVGGDGPGDPDNTRVASKVPKILPKITKEQRVSEPYQTRSLDVGKTGDLLGYVGDYGGFAVNQAIKGAKYVKSNTTIITKLGYETKYSKVMNALGTTSEAFEVAGSVGGLFGIYANVNDYQNGNLSRGRLDYRLLGIGATAAAATVGFVPAVTTAGTFYAGEESYDGFQTWLNATAKYITDFNQRVSNGGRPW